jgi:hypothetical protein
MFLNTSKPDTNRNTSPVHNSEITAAVSLFCFFVLFLPSLKFAFEINKCYRIFLSFNDVMKLQRNEKSTIF